MEKRDILSKSTKKYYFDADGRFVIENYNETKPFASFLPGIAGKDGVPLWVFYVNRAQAIASFGIANKDNPIMEFHPAFRSYKEVFVHGFRTFLKFEDGIVYEPFIYNHCNRDELEKGSVIQRMHIGAGDLKILEMNKQKGFEMSVMYFSLPNERLAALVRMVELKNVSSKPWSVEILDGLPVVLPYGLSDHGLKHVGNTLKAWMEVYNLESGIPIFKLRSSTEDSVEVKEFKEGNFYLSILEEKEKSKLVFPIVDADLVFGYNTSYIYPSLFASTSLEEIQSREQIKNNKIPCAFSPINTTLEPGESVTLYTIVGHIPDISVLEEYKERFSNKEYLKRKFEENFEIIKNLTTDIDTHTSCRLFDEYSKQTYLDNILRGGYPLVFKEGEKIYHIYSRKHGDLERDYNYFSLLAEYYSSGNANYRDVNQNRRNDVLFNPSVERFNIKFFLNLVQCDGYNPLVINGVRYRLKEFSNEFLANLAEPVDKLREFFEKNTFTPGRLLTFVEKENIKLKVSKEEFLNVIINKALQEIDAVHGEGFWTDHWTYNLDLVESYLEIYPEREEELLFNDRDYTYYDNYVVVLPRDKRFVLVDGKVRQFYSLAEDSEKRKLIESRNEYKNVMRVKNGNGDIYKTTLVTKLINLAAIKFATTDPDGIGIEMEAGKPGWYDALNGLPGLSGSSVADSFETLRLLDFLAEKLEVYGDRIVELPIEVMELIEREVEIVNEYEISREDKESKNLKYWNDISDLREAYREKTKFGFSGEEFSISANKLKDKLNKLIGKLKSTLELAIEENNGIMPTYYYFEVVDYDIVGEMNGRKLVKPNKFKRVNLPLFLEGIVRGFKVIRDKERIKKIFSAVKQSSLFDEKLKMYKVNASLKDQSVEIGRAKTFTPGWLENESIWLHMEYKYILEVLKAGLYEEFYDDFKNIFIPFLNPEVYGRSPLENSSFIVSSANPDESIHGTGFVARLSGSTAEFLSIWKLLFIGSRPFRYENGELTLTFEPALPGWLFNEEAMVKFKFLGKCDVTYINKSRKDTWKLTKQDREQAKIRLYLSNEETVDVTGLVIRQPYAQMVREGKVYKIEVDF